MAESKISQNGVRVLRALVGAFGQSRVAGEFGVSGKTIKVTLDGSKRLYSKLAARMQLKTCLSAEWLMANETDRLQPDVLTDLWNGKNHLLPEPEFLRALGLEIPSEIEKFSPAFRYQLRKYRRLRQQERLTAIMDFYERTGKAPILDAALDEFFMEMEAGTVLAAHATRDAQLPPEVRVCVALLKRLSFPDITASLELNSEAVNHRKDFADRIRRIEESLCQNSLSKLFGNGNHKSDASN